MKPGGGAKGGSLQCCSVGLASGNEKTLDDGLPGRWHSGWHESEEMTGLAC